VLPAAIHADASGIAAHHQQLCFELAAFFDERVSNLVFLADGAIFNGIDA
jgi:hypothetical protein